MKNPTIDPVLLTRRNSDSPQERRDSFRHLFRKRRNSASKIVSSRHATIFFWESPFPKKNHYV